MEGKGDPVSPPLDPSHPEKSEFLRYSLDLYNYGYFWESHVYFESLWNAHQRVGPVADFLKGMIKLGAAGVKFNISQKEAAIGHLNRARELFLIVMKLEGTNFLGFDLEEIVREIDLALVEGVKCPVIHPKW